MYKISIIVPAHNEEKYIEQCLQSIINQTMDFKNFEVIMIDDASTDNTYEIMKKYDDYYHNFISIKRNIASGSAGRPRNDAIKIASGKYLMFIDADDTYEQDACECMYNMIEETGADFITANAIDMTEDGEKTNLFMSIDAYDNQEIKIENLKRNVLPMSCSACFKIFNTKFVKDNNLKFLEGVPAEDSYFSYTSLMKSQKAYYLNKVIYNYRKRYSENNLSVSTNFSQRYFENINYSYRKIYDEFNNNGCIQYYNAYYLNGLFYVLFNFITSNKLDLDQRENILNLMQWFFNILTELNIDLNLIHDEIGIIEFILKVENNDIENAIKIFESIQLKIQNLTREQIRDLKYNLREKAKVL